MVPTEILACAVPVPANARPQPFNLRDECVSIEVREIFVHSYFRCSRMYAIQIGAKGDVHPFGTG